MSISLEITFVIILGLCLGSFVNVVVYRLPRMLVAQWEREARAILTLAPAAEPPTLTLAAPRSHCLHCQAPIAWHDNIPLLGWLKRRGKCAQCNTAISYQYPLVEAFSALLALAVWSQLGTSLMGLCVLLACFALLALALIDWHTQLLPDAITLPLLWSGLLFTLCFRPQSLDDAVIGAMLGYGLLWCVYWLFKLMTGKEGMGYGDFKLLAALGAWVGWQQLPLILLASAGTGAVVGLLLLAVSGKQRGAVMPFGPFLAFGGWLSLLTDDGIMSRYWMMGG
ncbi:prepilin peptidase [Halomonas dongshanensis]|uniref:Prepilin leader peptidase/N-methyltransferase n=1 Tax=Halomonas dongshanensis TaxID=2890835 RepID=A0ABT2EFH6_9GAMM|nr:A24 family peptidase [Halomonas dongshanensis]MCS2609367.1 A24 family peptidase [Halomonas dongshanensis]